MISNLICTAAIHRSCPNGEKRKKSNYNAINHSPFVPDNLFKSFDFLCTFPFTTTHIKSSEEFLCVNWHDNANVEHFVRGLITLSSTMSNTIVVSCINCDEHLVQLGVMQVKWFPDNELLSILPVGNYEGTWFSLSTIFRHV